MKRVTLIEVIFNWSNWKFWIEAVLKIYNEQQGGNTAKTDGNDEPEIPPIVVIPPPPKSK